MSDESDKRFSDPASGLRHKDTGEPFSGSINADQLEDPAQGSWDRMLTSMSTFIAAAQAYSKAHGQSLDATINDFCTGYDEGGDSNLVPNDVYLVMLSHFNNFGVSEDLIDSRHRRELILDLSEKYSPAELQDLYHVVVKATKLQ